MSVWILYVALWKPGIFLGDTRSYATKHECQREALTVKLGIGQRYKDKVIKCVEREVKWD